jgi:hypothetical protein
MDIAAGMDMSPRSSFARLALMWSAALCVMVDAKSGSAAS